MKKVYACLAGEWYVLTMTPTAKSANTENHRISGGKRGLPSILHAIRIKNLNIAFMVLIMFTFITKGMIGESTLCLSKL